MRCGQKRPKLVVNVTAVKGVVAIWSRLLSCHFQAQWNKRTAAINIIYVDSAEIVHVFVSERVPGRAGGPSQTTIQTGPQTCPCSQARPSQSLILGLGSSPLPRLLTPQPGSLAEPRSAEDPGARDSVGEGYGWLGANLLCTPSLITLYRHLALFTQDTKLFMHVSSLKFSLYTFHTLPSSWDIFQNRPRRFATFKTKHNKDSAITFDRPIDRVASES